MSYFEKTRIAKASGVVINPATEETLQAVAGLNVPAHDEVVITYVTVGNGIGEIYTVTYKLATVTQATLTLSYDGNNKLSGVVKS